MSFGMFVRPAFWIALVWGGLFLLNRYTTFPEMHWLAIVFLGLGIYVFKERPLVTAGYAAPFETGIAALCALVFFAHMGWIFLEPKLEAERLSALPCTSKTLELQCYTFSQDNCSALWSHFEKDCQENLKRELAARPSTALVGPRVRRCIYKKLDQSFKSNRRTPTDPACQQHFSSLEGLANQ